MPHRDDLIWALWFGSEEQVEHRVRSNLRATTEEYARHDAIRAEAIAEHFKQTGIKNYGDDHFRAEFNNNIAQHEGWGIFLTGREGRNYQLQKIDELVVFRDDEEAWRHVALGALSGIRYHKEALMFLAKNSPLEFKVMRDVLHPLLDDLHSLLLSGE